MPVGWGASAGSRLLCAWSCETAPSRAVFCVRSDRSFGLALFGRLSTRFVDMLSVHACFGDVMQNSMHNSRFEDVTRAFFAAMYLSPGRGVCSVCYGVCCLTTIATNDAASLPLQKQNSLNPQAPQTLPMWMRQGSLGWNLNIYKYSSMLHPLNPSCFLDVRSFGTC